MHIERYEEWVQQLLRGDDFPNYTMSTSTATGIDAWASDYLAARRDLTRQGLRENMPPALADIAARYDEEDAQRQVRQHLDVIHDRNNDQVDSYYNRKRRITEFEFYEDLGCTQADWDVADRVNQLRALRGYFFYHEVTPLEVHEYRRQPSSPPRWTSWYFDEEGEPFFTDGRTPESVFRRPN